MPSIIMDAVNSGSALDYSTPALRSLSDEQLALVVEYTDMIVLDYLTQHTDR